MRSRTAIESGNETSEPAERRLSRSGIVEIKVYHGPNHPESLQ